MIDVQALDSFSEQILVEINPSREQYFDQLLEKNMPAEGPLRTVVQNLIDVPITKEEKRELQPLHPQACQPVVPARRRGRRREELLRQFSPYLPVNIQTVTDYQNEILNLYDDAWHEGEEMRGAGK